MQNSSSKATVSETTKYAIMYLYAAAILISGFVFVFIYGGSIGQIISGLGEIIKSRSILVSDYIVLGELGTALEAMDAEALKEAMKAFTGVGIGVALINCGLTTIASIIVAQVADVEMKGVVIAAIFTIAGFALFGKNVYNIWAIYLGAYLNSVYSKQPFKNYAVPAFFGTALGPLVSHITFGLGLSLPQGLILGNLAGITAGFILPYMASHFPKFHQGFNLYNIGFTCGMTGFLYMSLLRGFGKNHATLSIALPSYEYGYNTLFAVYFGVMCITMIALGWYFNDKSFSGYNTFLSRSGQAPTDFVALDGFGLTFVNMGIIGIISIVYVLLVKGDLNGPNLGGVLTVIAFGAYGKHTKNILPVMLGVFLASKFMPGLPNPGALSPVLAALFGTTLAPLAGKFGIIPGIISGFVHMLAVVNTAGLHGGMDLYNNGFTGGLVAACLGIVFMGIMKTREKEELAKAK